jgi:hypothetical protein
MQQGPEYLLHATTIQTITVSRKQHKQELSLAIFINILHNYRPYGVVTSNIATIPCQRKNSTQCKRQKLLIPTTQTECKSTAMAPTKVLGFAAVVEYIHNMLPAPKQL